MQNLVKSFLQTSRQGVLHSTNLWKQALPSSLCFVPAETIYSAQQKTLVRYPDVLMPFTANNLWDNDCARKKGRRIGRGPGSSKGKTSGKGFKGQTARQGGSVPVWLEGGQTPLQDRLPKWGISKKSRDFLNYVNLGNLVYYIKSGRLDASKPITIKDMYEAGVFSKIKYGVKILGRGLEKLDFPIHLEVSDASEQAIKHIQEKGGSVKCVYRTQLKLREHIHPERFPLELEDPLPTPKMVMRMERVKERGAEVVYREPAWVKKEREEGNKILKENAEIDGFKLPADRSPGCGANKIRKRRPQLIKDINFGLVQ